MRDAPHHGGVVCELDDDIALVDGDAVVCIKDVEQRAQYTALWGPSTREER